MIDQFTREAEAAKANVHALPGMNKSRCDQRLDALDKFASCLKLSKTFLHSAMVDESYQMVGAHLDESLKRKIIKHEYVDLVRLLPRDRVRSETDNQLEMVNRGGKTYWVPYSDRDLTVINSYHRWDLAFRIFCDVFTRQHPNRASELIQYHHLIQSTSLSYVWDNMYAYDIDFRLHLSRNPERSWALILQQAWSYRLKEKLSVNRSSSGDHRGFGSNGGDSPEKFVSSLIGGCVTMVVTASLITVAEFVGNLDMEHITGRFGPGGSSTNYSYFSDRETGEKSKRDRPRGSGDKNSAPQRK